MTVAMKSSGVNWLGEIPAHWECRRGKSLFATRTTKGNEIGEHLAATQKYGMYPQRLLEGVVRINENKDIQEFKTVHVNDYVISLRSFQGGFEMSAYEGVCTPAYTVFYATEEIYNVYFKYLFKCQGFISEMDSLTTGIREGRNISFTDFGNTYLPVPCVQEQKAIADYLDDKCAEIESAIASAEASIDEYKAYRKSVIFTAVTKGLDGAVPMRDSGVTWIGEIPAHWMVSKFKRGYRRVSLSGFPEEELLSVYLNRGVIRYSESTGMQVHKPSEKLDKYQLVKPGWLVLNNQQAWRGSVGVSVHTGIISPAYHIYEPVSDELDISFANYYFRSAYVPVFEICSTGVGSIQRNLSAEKLITQNMILPPIQEQKIIADYLDTKCAAIQQVIDSKQAIIEELKAYKKSLIFEVVTGKKEI